MRFRAVVTDGGNWKVEERREICPECGGRAERWSTVAYAYYLLPREQQQQIAEAIAEAFNAKRDIG